MANPNFTASSSTPDQQSGHVRFWAEVKHGFTSPRGREILAGDHIMIDPSRQPRELDLVVVGNTVQSWAGQEDIRGVVTAVSRSV